MNCLMIIDSKTLWQNLVQNKKNPDLDGGLPSSLKQIHCMFVSLFSIYDFLFVYDNLFRGNNLQK